MGRPQGHHRCGRRPGRHVAGPDVQGQIRRRDTSRDHVLRQPTKARQASCEAEATSWLRARYRLHEPKRPRQEEAAAVRPRHWRGSVASACSAAGRAIPANTSSISREVGLAFGVRPQSVAAAGSGVQYAPSTCRPATPRSLLAFASAQIRDLACRRPSTGTPISRILRHDRIQPGGSSLPLRSAGSAEALSPTGAPP